MSMYAYIIEYLHFSGKKITFPYYSLPGSFMNVGSNKHVHGASVFIYEPGFIYKATFIYCFGAAPDKCTCMYCISCIMYHVANELNANQSKLC